MWKAEGVELRREVDSSRLRPLPLERTHDVISLNHEYFELELSEAEARDVVDDEAKLIERLEEAGDDDQAVVDLLDERYEDCDETAALDPGMAGVVAALTAKGGTTITSCNGGILGVRHLCDAPTVLFACPLPLLPAVDVAAAATGCGLIDNDGFLELFADDLRKMNRFARALLEMDAAG